MPAITSHFRILTLILGPIALISLAHWLSFAGSPDVRPAPDAAVAASIEKQAEIEREQHGQLAVACESTAEALARRLGADYRFLVKTPFVLGGDLSVTDLERYHDEVILPTRRALTTAFFDTPPDKPITILMCGTESSYRRCASKLEGNPRAAYYGFYQRQFRRIVLNLSTGDGTLTHELTHALAHPDFPQMPEWFDEGLASLFEQSEMSADGLVLKGTTNWRWNYLQPELRAGRLPTISQMLQRQTVRADHEAVDYAYARYFCLYLQERGLLSHFYRKFRATRFSDPIGRAALREVVQTTDLEIVNTNFLSWLRQFDEDPPSLQSTASRTPPRN